MPRPERHAEVEGRIGVLDIESRFGTNTRYCCSLTSKLEAQNLQEPQGQPHTNSINYPELDQLQYC